MLRGGKGEGSEAERGDCYGFLWEVATYKYRTVWGKATKEIPSGRLFRRGNGAEQDGKGQKVKGKKVASALKKEEERMTMKRIERRPITAQHLSGEKNPRKPFVRLNGKTFSFSGRKRKRKEGEEHFPSVLLFFHEGAAFFKPSKRVHELIHGELSGLAAGARKGKKGGQKGRKKKKGTGIMAHPMVRA